ncbi:porin [Kushneria aurantia]|uniref:Porin n=1 Tax=Kushneria aurantia TaxID=504092 RepID=A0ABV6G5C1_9GAMM|nr:porin [Kushneria aurantia]
MSTIKRISIVSGLLGATALSPAATAVTLYETTDARLELSGRIAAYSTFENGADNDTDPKNAGSRVRLIHEYNLEDGWSTIARAEWGFDPFYENGTDAHYKRLLYAGVSNPDYGTFLIGKQYSMWYDMVAWWTDYFWINGATAQGSFNGGGTSDGALQGLGRPDNAISWRKDWGKWDTGLLYQTSGDDISAPGDFGGISRLERQYTFQGAAIYHFTEDFQVGGTWSTSKLETTRDAGGNGKDIDVNSGLMAVNWTPGNWYFALTGGSYHNLVFDGDFQGVEGNNGLIDEARGYEGVALYNLLDQTPGTVQLYTGFNRLQDQDSDARNGFYLAGIAWLLLDDDLILSAEYSLDDSQNASGDDVGNNDTKLMVRYNF